MTRPKTQFAGAEGAVGWPKNKLAKGPTRAIWVDPGRSLLILVGWLFAGAEGAVGWPKTKPLLVARQGSGIDVRGGSKGGARGGSWCQILVRGTPRGRLPFRI